MSCDVPLPSIEVQPGSSSSTSSIAVVPHHSDIYRGHSKCLHNPFTLPEATPDHLTKFPDHVDVAALRKLLSQPFVLPESIEDHLVEFPTPAVMEAPPEHASSTHVTQSPTIARPNTATRAEGELQLRELLNRSTSITKIASAPRPEYKLKGLPLLEELRKKHKQSERCA